MDTRRMIIFMSDLKIPYENLTLANHSMFDEIQTAIRSVVEKGWYILGSEVQNFEKDFSNYVGAPYCAGVASGLDALIIALKTLGLPSDAEVIVPSNTYIATILSILQEGFKPILVEPDIRTYNIDPKKIEAAITPKTKAIMVVHLYGKACQMDEIEAIAKKHGLALIEDCAQSHGAKFKDQMTGTFGIGAFSFYPTKNLGAMGDAGAITANDANTDEKIRMIRNYGSKIKYFNEVVGMNSRLDEMQAAILRVKLKYLNKITEHKRKMAEVYFQELSSLSDLILPQVSQDFFDVYHIYNVRFNRRDDLKKYLLEKGIGTEVHYPVPPHQQKALFGKLEQVQFPISEEIHKTTLSLPISYAHSLNDIQEVCLSIRAFFS